jgi:N-acyl-D-amino-acid deacylase
LTWGEAIAKMTGRPAEKLGLKQRGLLKAGYFADITLFDPEAVRDNATYKEPHLPPSGIPHVMVNGAWALKDGAVTRNLGGRILRAGD